LWWYTCCNLLLRKELLHLVNYPVELLRVLGYAVDLLLVEVGGDGLAEQDLRDDVAKIRRTGSVF
jgi:hypothetical protein